MTLAPTNSPWVARLGTEFGAALMRLVLETPGAMAAVLSDEQGNAIDFVHDPGAISELDVQILGAQIGQAILRLHAGARNRHLGSPAVLVEADRGTFVAGAVAETYVVALLLELRANIAEAFSTFDTVRLAIGDMLHN